MSENKKGKTMKNGFNSVYLCVIYSAVLIVFEHDLYMYDVPPFAHTTCRFHEKILSSSSRWWEPLA